MRVGLFPGQGVPADMIFEALPEDASLLEDASGVAGYDIRERVRSFAERGVALPTAVAQPAMFVGSLVSWSRAQDSDASFDYLAGHSLGEYPALVAAGSMTAMDALRGVMVRAEAMDETARSLNGGMAAVMKLGLEDVERIADENGVSVANDNAPGQIVLSGERERLRTASRAVEEAGGRWIGLDVSGPFHSADMAADAPALGEALRQVEINAPRIPVISNVTARPHSEPEEIRALLVQQLTGRVRFRESLEYLWEQGVREFEDLGPGDVVGGLAKRTFRELERTEVSAGV